MWYHLSWLRLLTSGMAGFVVFLGLLAGCSGESSESSPDTVVHSYSARGRIVQLPDPSNPASELSIHHEAISDFQLGDGTPAPMGAMTMPFPPKEGVSLQGLSVGDVVEFGFEVQWQPSPGMSLTVINKLPEGTVLDFEGSSSEPMDQGDAAHH
jgi:Cu/Ag efflux protein CusF